MIPENDPRRCPGCGGIHLGGTKCPLIRTTPSKGKCGRSSFSPQAKVAFAVPNGF